MKYCSWFEFDPIQDAVRLQDANLKGNAKRLVSSYVISPQLAECLTGLVFPGLAPDGPAEARALMVVGGRGTGKSHLLSVLSSLAEHADLVEAVTASAGLRIDEKGAAGGRAGLESVAGRFRVVRAELGAGAKSLQYAVARQIEAYFESLGMMCSFTADAARNSPRAVLQEIMAQFHCQFPEQGLLLVVDDLLEYLGRHSGQELNADLDFLEAVSEACRCFRLRFLAGVDKDLFDHPRSSFVAESLDRIKRTFAVVPIRDREALFVVSKRVARKTPVQKQLIEQHLARFATFHPGMRERLEDFVATFPVHPDYFAVVERTPAVKAREVLRTVSEAIGRLLDEEVPADSPGLIAYDQYWEKLRSDATLHEVIEIEAVADFSRSLERKIEKSLPHPEHESLALRLLHALSVHRLAVGDIYSCQGVTAADLCDALCLHQPGMEELPGEPSANLASCVAAVLDEICATVGEHHLSFNPQNGQYCLHLRRFKRFVKPELMLHWANALPFVLLMVTGGVMVASRFFLIDRKLVVHVETLHKTLALVWVTALPLAFLLRPRVHWRNVRVISRWGKEDLLWLVQSVRGLYNKEVAPGPAGRFNTGQKINACLVVMYFFAFAATGGLMFFAGSVLSPWYVHTALFFAAAGSVGGHLYLSLINPSTRIALAGIFHGWSPMEYVKHHHPLSLSPAHRSHLESAHVRTPNEELFLSRMEILFLGVALLMAGVGGCVYGKGQLASAKQGFAKSFADCIKPDALSTKHRIGPLAESCTKCHSYTGKIPDKNCEQCHRIVQERRTAQFGYHGTLKGDCISCHKEHLATRASIIPMAREKFDHNLAGFKREGKHAKLECDDCHQKKRSVGAPGIYYMGLKYGSCTDCHHDPHRGQFSASCEKCHSANSWHGKELKFVHETDSSFKLEGKHASTDCVKCHKPTPPGTALGTATFKGLSHECAGCHEDPHQKQFVAKCETCHRPGAWKKDALTFNHNQDSKFALSGKHLEVSCEKCHLPRTPGGPLAAARFHGLSSECADCHKDPHRGQFDRLCVKCHTAIAWKRQNLVFDHNKDSKFSLLEKHAEVACEKCHVPAAAGASLATAQFRGLGSECVGCHKDPHRGQFELACTRCHSKPTGWAVKQLNFQHDRDTKFALAGKHTTVECQKCHQPPTAGGALASATFRGLGTACEVCHKVTHPAAYGRDCLSCHDTRRWPKKDPGVDHILARKADGEPLSGKHLATECKACHVDSRMATLGLASQPGFGCGTCHQKEDPHKGTLGAHCTKCHDLEGWKGEHLLFNHDTMTRYALNQDHRNVACAKCHKNQQWKPLDDKCDSCHPKFFEKRNK